MKKLLFVMVLALGAVALMAPPAMAQDEKPFTLHGEVRTRGEYLDNTQDFDDDDTSDEGLAWPYRVRIAAEGHFAKNITAWIEFQNSGVFGGDEGPFKNGSGEVDFGNQAQLYQGNITLNELWSKKFSLRIGRQEIVAGTELLLGDLDFYAGISHDGGVGNWKFDKWNLMVWYTRPSEGSGFNGDFGIFPPDQVFVNNCPNCSTVHFLGGYANWTVAKNQGIDVYLMSIADRSDGANFQTLGGRYSHDVSGKNGLFWNVELAVQTGQVESELIGGTADIDAGGSVLEGWIGWNFKTGKNNHRIYARYTSASGDDDPTDDSFDAFVPLFGDFHNRLGHGDFLQVSGSPTQLGGGAADDLGVNAFALGWTGQFGDRSELGAEFWSFSSSESDPATDEDAIGSEIDVFYNYNYSKNMTFSASLSQFTPDDLLTGGGVDDTVTRLYGNARFRF
ncbi:MAG TPA: alginate export family protein [Candidatus Polarisedimenticolia bacterium]|jgi:hypothetical protein|nr:alginate export family protein [Candidatus Polarisedimenticolia bacterium]